MECEKESPNFFHHFLPLLLEGAKISAKLKIKIFTPNVSTWNVGLGADGMKWVWGKLQVVTGIIYHKTDIEYTDTSRLVFSLQNF